MKLLAIDPSLTSTGYSFFVDEEEKYTNHIPTGLEPSGVRYRKIKRVKYIKDSLIDYILNEKIDSVVIESYAYGSGLGGSRNVDMGELGGAIRLALFENNIPYEEIQIQHLKKYVTGKGNASKEMVMKGCEKRFNRIFQNNDECDAYCMGMFIHEMKELGIKEFLKKYELNANKKKYNLEGIL